MADKEYKVKIVTLGDPAGANAVADSLDKVGRSARKGKDDSKEAGDAIETFGKKGAAAQDAFEGLSRVAGGGAGAIFGFAKAWRALTEAFLANPITATLAALLALLPLVKAGLDLFVGSVTKARDELYGTGKASAELAANLKKNEEAAKKAGEAMKTAAEIASTEFERLNRNIDDSTRRLDLLAKAEQEHALAQIDLQEAEQLAAAKNDEQRKAIKSAADARRGAINQIADIDGRAREENAAIKKQQAAEVTIGQVQAQLAAGAAVIEKLNLRMAGTTSAGRDYARSGVASPAGLTQFNQLIIDTRDELTKATANLAELTKKLQPTLESATRQRADANATLDAAELRRQAQVTRLVAGGINQRTERDSQQPGLHKSIAEDQARLMIGSDPEKGIREQQEAIFKRAMEINAAAISQRGIQAGETMGEATAMAIREIFPQMTQAYTRLIRAEIDSAIKAEVDRIDSQIKGLRTR